MRVKINKLEGTNNSFIRRLNWKQKNNKIKKKLKIWGPN
jgi:hypothetical protein